MEAMYREGSPERDWEVEQRQEAAYRAELGADPYLSDEEMEERDRAWEARRSIWDEYQERFEAENHIELREFRQPAGMQLDLFREVA